MKKYLKVQSDRKNYHVNPFKNTVHRSSLLAPVMPKAQTWVTFVNHFLLKRNYKSVALKIVAIGGEGEFIDSNTLEIYEPKVYSYNLSKLFYNNKKIKNYLIEFYSDKNLFIPFPAVIVSHRGKDFCNIVHSFNRVLNDVFENDEINQEVVAESSFEVKVNRKFDTFFNVATGMNSVKGNLKISYEKNKTQINKNLKVFIPRLGYKSFYLSKIMPKIPEGGTIKINQPKPELFFGRMFVGRINKKTKAFSANHSFYDMSKTKEYFNSDISYRTYPYFENYSNKIILYPIFSPCKLDIYLEVKNKDKTFRSKKFKFESNSSIPLEIDVSEFISSIKAKNINAFTVLAKSKKNKIPTRVNHQLVYGGLSKNGSLSCSINVSGIPVCGYSIIIKAWDSDHGPEAFFE